MLYIRNVKILENEYSKSMGSANEIGKVVKCPFNEEFDYQVELETGEIDLFTKEEVEFVDEVKDIQSERLTTGQMLDQLQVGQIAEGSTHWEVKKLEDGRIIELNSGDTFGIDSSFLNEQWRIIPKYSTFEEAMAALQNGKKVSFYNHDWQVTFDKFDYIGGYAFKDLFQGTWVIEN